MSGDHQQETVSPSSLYLWVKSRCGKVFLIYDPLFFFFKLSIVDLQCHVSFRCRAVIQLHMCVCVYICIMYIYVIFFRFFSLIGYCTILSRVPELYSRSLLFICLTYSRVYLSPCPCAAPVFSRAFSQHQCSSVYLKFTLGFLQELGNLPRFMQSHVFNKK